MGFKKKFGAGTAVVASCGVVALLVSASPGAAAEEPDYNNANQISSTVRKSVAVTSDANGQVNNSVMVTQVSSVGKGQTTINVPVNATSARNLDGFGGITVNNKEAVFNLNLNGNQEQRIMTNSGPGPIEITAEATLDGQPIKPSEVVNKTGVLKVKYTVVNTEKQVVDVTTRDDKGNETTEQQEVDAPIGGSVAITLPQGFNEITAPGASMGGDGQGGTSLNYSLVMFKPLGNPVATLEYESRIANGTIPQAEFTMLPIVPMENSTIKTARSSFETGVQTGDKIADAGKQIGDGAGTLGEGVAKAADGAQTLADGLSGKLLPGANALAAGAGELSSGISGTLQPGANELATKLAAGAKSAPALVEGADQLNAGGKTLSTSLKKFQAAVEAMPEGVTGSAAYQQQMAALNVALSTLVSGCGPAGGGSDPCPDGVTNPPGVPNPTTLAGGLTSFQTVLHAGCDLAVGQAATCKQVIAGSQGYMGQAAPQIAGNLKTLLPFVVPVILGQVQSGLLGTTACGPKDPDSGKALQCIVAGSETLSNGIDQLAGQAPALVTGMQAAAAGAGQLADGINDTLAPGASALADGAAQLADGVPTAADGAQQLADGLPAAVEGADKLSAGGKELEASGQAAAGTFAAQVSGIDAAQQLGVKGVGIPNGGMATGENVTTTGAYKITLNAAQTPEQNNGLRFGLAALALIVAGGAGTVIYRRRHGEA